MEPPERIEALLLTQDQCSLCDHGKNLLARLAEELPLVVQTQDLGSEAGRALAERGGVMFPPGLFLDGEPYAYGRLSERRLRRELRRRLGR